MLSGILSKFLLGLAKKHGGEVQFLLYFLHYANTRIQSSSCKDCRCCKLVGQCSSSEKSILNKYDTGKHCNRGKKVHIGDTMDIK